MELIAHPQATLDAWASSLLRFLGPSLPSTSPAFATVLFSSAGTVEVLFDHHLRLNRVALVPGAVGDEMWYVVNDYALAGLDGAGVSGLETGFYALALTGAVLPKLHDFRVIIPSRHGWLGPVALQRHLASLYTRKPGANTLRTKPCFAPDALTHADHVRYMLSHLLEGYAAECDWAGKTRMQVLVDVVDGMPPDRRVRRAVRTVLERRGFKRDHVEGESGKAWVTREERSVRAAHRHRTHRSMTSIELPVSPVSSFEFDVE